VVTRPRMLRLQEQPTDFARRLEGRRIAGTARHGKHLLVGLDGGVTWIIHLGMSGRISVADGAAPAPAHTHVTVELDDGSEVRFTDPRTFGYTVALLDDELDAAPYARYGPDALAAPPSVAVLTDRLDRRTAPIKALLLDQRLLAGVGNIYADEALFAAGIAPHRKGGDLDAGELERLLAAIDETLTAGIAAGGTTLEDLAYLLPDGRAGEFTTALRAYGREGEPCVRCGGSIRRDVIRNRSTFWCLGCQR